jgi:hypothetical protein
VPAPAPVEFVCCVITSSSRAKKRVREFLSNRVRHTKEPAGFFFLVGVCFCVFLIVETQGGVDSLEEYSTENDLNGEFELCPSVTSLICLRQIRHGNIFISTPAPPPSPLYISISFVIKIIIFQYVFETRFCLLLEACP